MHVLGIALARLGNVGSRVHDEALRHLDDALRQAASAPAFPRREQPECRHGR